MSPKIKDNALFISDAHANIHRDEFLHFLKKLDNKKIKTSQLFLMGDMFDLLVGQVSYTKTIFKEYIDLINKLSFEIEIFYIEGNHDFNLQSIFPNIKVFKIQNQPVLFTYKNNNILLSHGDLYNGTRYKIYCYISRNQIILKLLNITDILTKNFISKKILSNQVKKQICFKINNFKNLAKQKIIKYDIGLRKIDFVCEGHYHQNQKFILENIKYINFSCFACDKSYYKINFEQEVSLKEII